MVKVSGHQVMDFYNIRIFFAAIFFTNAFGFFFERLWGQGVSFLINKFVFNIFFSQPYNQPQRLGFTTKIFPCHIIKYFHRVGIHMILVMFDVGFQFIRTTFARLLIIFSSFSNFPFRMCQWMFFMLFY